MAPIVLFDACVLYPAPLRDLLMRLALTNVFQARWTDEIHDEWTRSVLANRPDLSAQNLARCRELMNLHVPDSLIKGYETLIPSLNLPDPNDRHVLAAAIHGGVGCIVTFNLSDFPTRTLKSYSIEPIHPDEFIVSLWEEHSDAVQDAVRRQRASLKNPPRSIVELLATLEQCGLAETVTYLRDCANTL